jgi:outer membrane protein assembly factor BamB
VLGNIDSSPVIRNGRVYVGSTILGGTVHSFDALTGGDERTYVHGDGQVKGFVFPDRASNDLYFATDGFVWGVTDTGAPAMTNKFGSGVVLAGGVTPSSGVLFVPGSHYVYVGGSDGKLYELDTLGAPGIKSVTLGDGLAAIGSPSLDIGFTPNLVHVGSVAGIFYAVQVPLP